MSINYPSLLPPSVATTPITITLTAVQSRVMAHFCPTQPTLTPILPSRRTSFKAVVTGVARQGIAHRDLKPGYNCGPTTRVARCYLSTRRDLDPHRTTSKRQSSLKRNGLLTGQTRHPEMSGLRAILTMVQAHSTMV
ncbi:hypothetical protein BDV93DRAFT_526830 [Ceratobasidium sp. AG-I]|nr:hypothetical protein BDV93DRAFT_526830 [Ceratobasidium sp. AG-I]